MTDQVLGAVMSNIISRLREGRIDGEQALDELALIDPETELGKAMTDLMIRVTSLELLNQYLGYTREEGKIRVFFAPEAKEDTLRKLLDQTMRHREKYSVDQDMAPVEILSAQLLRTDTDPKENQWVLEMNIQMSSMDYEPGMDGDVPVEVDMSGHVKPGEKNNNSEMEPEPGDDE